MRILAVSDIESKSLYDFFSPEKVEGVELIIGCGDLREEYLEFLVTMMNVPLLYIHGNHDDHFKREPEGCVCIDDKFYEYKGIRFVGLGGSFRYRDGKYMYTEGEMKRRIFKLMPKLLFHKGFDVLVTHCPARHLNDFDTITHRGFDCFNRLLEKYKPKLFMHGHIHRNYGARIPQKSDHNGTLVINASDYCIFDIDI
ncbi:metallophosphoesterase family protein [Ruminococcus sp.]|uniref:metallophosphoesterase family protein n=1 Tax=Ruminococcus sp. TaxID=41978 RepID=UPI002E760597|nr:metallophosphoesterase [Ruminococcus sp.]MEE1263217.1 metallophosphoesterase family protein [Ruminococcus sp.]